MTYTVSSGTLNSTVPYHTIKVLCYGTQPTTLCECNAGLGAKCEQTACRPAPVCGSDRDRSVCGEGRTSDTGQSADAADDERSRRTQQSLHCALLLSILR